MSTFLVKHTPYLQLGNAPLAGFAGSETDQAQIIWQTVPASGSGNDSFVVEYRSAGAPTWIDAGPSSTIDTGVSNRVNRFVDITGLAYDADYEYRVRHLRDGSVVNDYQATFHTRLPVGSNQPFTFVAYGDSASGTPPTGFINVQNRINTITSSFVVMMGDNAYGSGTHANYDLRFDPTINAPTTQYNANHVEYYSLGNHDIATAAGQPSRDNYAVPIPVAGVTSSVNGPAGAPAENNYSFDFGNAHFSIYDSNDGISTAEADWMLADMQASTARWKFVVYHHPMSTTDALAEQLRAAGVDVLLAGHVHSYNRSNSGSQFTEGNQLIEVIGGTGGASTTIANQGFLKIDATANNLTVSYIRADSGNTVDTFSIIAQNTGTGSAPTNVALSANTVSENSANNIVAGTLTTTDPDAGDTHTYTLTNNAGGRFGISGNQLVVANGPPAGGLDFETNTSHTVTVRSTDSTGLNFSKNFTINVTNVNEVPTANSNAYVVNRGATLNANDATGTVGGTNDNSVLVNDTDPENNSLTAAKVTDPTHGTLTLNANGTFTYTHNNDSATSDSFTYRVADGTNQSNIATVTISIDPGEGAPTTVSLQEGVNGYAGTIDTTIKAAFPTSTTGSSATTVEANDNAGKGSLLRWELPLIPIGSIVQSASITLWITNTTTTTYQLYELLRSWTEGGATWNEFAAGTPWGTAGAQRIDVDRAAAVLASLTSPNTGFVTINLNSAGIAMVQKWIDTPSTNHGVTIQNYVTTTNNAVGFDSSEATTAANRPKLTFTYSIPPTPPLITTTASALSYTENNPALAIDLGLTTSDPDSANYVGATVSITGGLTSGEDVLGFANQNGISGVYNAATGVLTLSGVSNPANYQTALRSVTYVNTSETPNSANRTLTFSVNDGAMIVSATRTISVTSVNDAPTALTLMGTTVQEQSPQGTILGDFSAVDPDVGDFHTYSLTDDAGGRFALSGNQLVVANGSLLDFETNANHLVTFHITDSGGLSVSRNFTINVSNLNEMPTALMLVGDRVPEQSEHHMDVGDLTTTDPDAGDFHTYALLDDAGGRFAIFGDQLVVANGSLLNSEANTSHTVTVLSTDSGGLSVSREFTINVTDAVNEFDPVLNNATFSLAENSANSTSAGTVAATDADATDGGLSYSITGGNALGIFAINSVTGVITVANNAKLNRESVASVVLTIAVSDNGPGAPRTDAAQVTININDVNDLTPVVTAGQSATINENLSNGSSVSTVVATDGDVTATTFQNWMITGGSGSTAFAIDASTGGVTVLDSAQLNREMTAGFTLLVAVADGVHTSLAQTVTISLNDVNEVPTANGNAYSVNRGATLNASDASGTVGGTNDNSVLVNDTDPENNALSAVLVAGPTHASGFILNTNGTFTYTHNNDSATSDSFTYQATDGPNQSNIATVTITINPGGGTTTTVSLQDGVNGYAGTIDTTIKSAFPTSTASSSATTVEANGNPDTGSLLRWELPSSLTGSIVQSASITLRVTNTTAITYELYELLRSWTEAGATWNQYAAGAGWGTVGAQQIGVDRAAAVLASFTSLSTGFVTINLNSDGIAMVQKWINTPSTNHGVAIQDYAGTSNDNVAFDSSEVTAAANRPKLTITYSTGGPINKPPTANSNAYSVNRGATLNANDAIGTVGGTNDDSVLVNDTDPENNTLTAVKVTDPTHGTLTLNANGTFTYTHNNDSATSDSFTYRVSDGSNQSNIATVTITINPGGGTSTTVSLQDGVNGYAGTIDTTINGAFPTSTFSSSAATVEANDNPDKGSLLRWELPSSLTGNIVQSASITLRVTNATTSTFQLYELLRSWTEGGATWNQYAAGAAWGKAGAQQLGVDRAAAVLASFTSPATGFVTINLNADGIKLVQKWINTPSTNHGVTIQNYVTTTGDSVLYNSSEAPTAAHRPKLTITYGSGSPLMAASTASVTSSAPTGSNLTDAALARIGQEATARWLTIVPAGMHDAIRTVARSITFAIADLPGQTLGTSFGQTILIDRDAAGFGWFIDRTPRDDREFGACHDARPTSPAYGHMDLLSVVAHELGHLLGYDHDSTLDVMQESLEAGHRTIAIDAFFQGVGSHHGGRKLNPFM